MGERAAAPVAGLQAVPAVVRASAAQPVVAPVVALAVRGWAAPEEPAVRPARAAAPGLRSPAEPGRQGARASNRVRPAAGPAARAPSPVPADAGPSRASAVRSAANAASGEPNAVSGATAARARRAWGRAR